MDDENKKVFHCWDDEEKRFFIWGDVSDSVWQRKVKAHEEFLIQVYKTAQWIMPVQRDKNDYTPQHFPLVKIETL